MGILANENAIQTGGYNIANSLRFQSASSQYLNRTMTASGSRQKFTVSMWIKRGLLNSNQALFSVGTGVVGDIAIGFGNGLGGAGTGDTITFGYAGVGNFNTTAVFRDPSAWYHVVISFDTTNATAANRLIIYINNSAYPLGSNIALNALININQNGSVVFFGRYAGINYFDGYMTEVNFIDGQALTPSSFGETNTLTGQWVAKKYTGTYGTNGFYLPFSNGTSTTTLGADSSGNGNNWTLNNFTRSAGVSDCWMNDVPSGNGGASGTQPNGNYCVANPLVSTGYSLLNGNLRVSTVGSGAAPSPATIAIYSGKWYWEVVVTSSIGSNAADIGIIDIRTNTVLGVGGNALGYSYFGNNGNKLNNSSTGSAYGAAYTVNDIIGVAFDADAGTLTFYKNNVSQGVAFTSIPQATYYPAVAKYTSTSGGSLDWNFGQRSFAYTPPSGFKALCTANLPASTIVKGNQYMDATTYSGQGTNLTLVNAGGFQPDIVWMKCRSNADDNALVDSVRGVIPALYPNSTTAEISAGYLTSFNSNGVTITTGYGTTNIAGRTYVAWQWDAGSSTVTNTNGTISSQVRANPTAGVSIVTYTGTGANATVGHGLGVAPKMIIIKNRTLGTSNWMVYHANANASPASGNLYLSATNAFTTAADAWNNTAPTSSVFSLGTSTWLNANTNNMVAYCFAEIAGFSKFGSYTGNGSADGTFVYTGFRPKFVMVKCTSSGTANFTWAIYDSARNEYNVMGQLLQANLSNAEAGAGTAIDFLSNGFKLRAANDGTNAVSQNYIYMAFAENPFANANAR